MISVIWRNDGRMLQVGAELDVAEEFRMRRNVFALGSAPSCWNAAGYALAGRRWRRRWMVMRTASEQENCHRS